MCWCDHTWLCKCLYLWTWLVQKEEMKQKCLVECLHWKDLCRATKFMFSCFHCHSNDNFHTKVVINSIIWRRLLSFIGRCTAVQHRCGCIVAFSGWKRNDSSAQQSSQVLPNTWIPPVMKKKSLFRFPHPLWWGQPCCADCIIGCCHGNRSAQKHWHRG